MIVGTAGHIDHGKTALVRALTGVDTDRLKEEKARGITIENGYAYQPLDPLQPDGARIGFVDMPGHERFIPTMLAGATGIDFALLAVAADDGVMPQTREHLQILQLLHISRGAVALTKIDRVDAARLTQVRQDIADLLAGTFLADVPVIGVSSVSGTGVDDLKAILHEAARTWHRARAEHVPTEQFRLAVDRCFSIEGRGTVVTGTVHAGSLQVGETVRVLSSAIDGRTHTARVRSLHALDRSAQTCQRGQRVSLNLVGLERSDVLRGDWVVATALTHRSERVSIALSLLAGAKTMQHWSPVHLHTGATHATAHVALLTADRLNPGDTTLAELVLDVPLHLCHGDRIVLRDASAQTTIGGAMVLDFCTPPRGKRSAQRLALLAAQRDTSAAQALQHTLALAPLGIDLGAFAANRNLPIAALMPMLSALQSISIPYPDGLYACAAQHWHAMQQAVLQTLETFHQREPDYAGIERERLRRASLPTVPALLFGALIESMLAAQLIGLIQRVFLARPEHRIAFSDSESRLWHKITPLLAATPFQPPRVRPLAVTLGIDEASARGLLGKSARLGHTHRIAHDHYFLDEAVRAMAASVLVLAERDGAASVAPFRDCIGTGRKLAVEILEFFDRTGFTRRIQDRHLLRQPAMWQP